MLHLCTCIGKSVVVVLHGVGCPASRVFRVRHAAVTDRARAVTFDTVFLPWRNLPLTWGAPHFRRCFFVVVFIMFGNTKSTSKGDHDDDDIK